MSRSRQLGSVLLLAATSLTLLARSDARAKQPQADNPLWPKELVDFVPYKGNPVFSVAWKNKWDAKMRERGWILHDQSGWSMWYTGYDGTREGKKMLGYATSADGIHWKPHPENPIYSKHWVEDMMVVKQDDTYYMFAEGKDDQAQLLESSDGVRWRRVGPLDIRLKNGKPISAGPRGTPTAYFEKGTWYLFYERYDQGVWLATSSDMKVWTNVQDEPVLKKGPAQYDRLMIAMNQIIKHKGRYYAYYHGSGSPTKPRLWSPAVATSTDLIHWEKYSGNPLRPMNENRSSGILVPSGKGSYLFYTMHDQVDLFIPQQPQ